MPQVLIVDDDEATRLTVRAALDLVTDDQHYVMAEAATGQQALDVLCAGADPTVVLLDLKMPVMDGHRVLDHVLADPVLAARCAFVCMTASAGLLPPELTAQLDASGIPVLAKPFDIDELLALVAAAAGTLPI